MEPAKERKPRRSRASNGSYVMGFVIIVFIITLIAGTIFRSLRPKKSCHYDNAYRRLTCKFKETTSFPDDLIDNALFLHIGDKNDKLENYFDVLSRSNLSKFRHLQGLALIKCGIERIETETFIDVPMLKTLDLRYNRIQTLPNNAFYGLRELEVLLLGNNPLLRLDSGVFSGTIIDVLSFGNNPALSDISEDVFDNATIRNIEFSRCNVATFKLGTLQPLRESLQNVTIRNNMQVLHIPEKLFENLTLSIADLSNNGIQDISFLVYLKAQEIVLAHNPLLTLKQAKVSPLSSAASNISFAHCQLESIADVNFSLFANLQHLDIRGNKLKIFNISVFEGLQHLETLDLSSNDIRAIAGNFTDAALLPNITLLRFHDNNIQMLAVAMESLFEKLDNVSLHGNPLHCNCELLWLAHWLEVTENRAKVQELGSITCETPEHENFTQVSDYGFQCRPPTILNATLDSESSGLICTAEGDPPPSVTWSSVSGEEHTTYPCAWNRTTFVTQNSLPLVQSGNYTCSAWNIVGNDTVLIDTKHMQSMGFKVPMKSDRIKIIETPEGFVMTCILLILLGYLLRTT